jgi:hypothetical protein
VHGFRYNAIVLARHIAETHFGIAPDRPVVKPDEAVPYLLREATRAPELWNQQSYLARVLLFDDGGGFRDEGILPLAHFVDAEGPDGIAMAVETDAEGDIHPAVYLRRAQKVEEHTLASSPMLDFESAEHVAQLTSLLKSVTG